MSRTRYTPRTADVLPAAVQFRRIEPAYTSLVTRRPEILNTTLVDLAGLAFAVSRLPATWQVQIEADAKGFRDAVCALPVPPNVEASELPA